MLAQGVAGVVPQAFGDQLAAGVEVFDALGDHLGGDAVDIDLLLLFREAVGDRDVRPVYDDLIRARLGRDAVFAVVYRRDVVWGRDWVEIARLIDLHRLAIELGVGEMVGRAPEVHQGEIILLGVFVDPRAPAHDLLELGHRADWAVENDQPAGLGVHAR